MDKEGSQGLNTPTDKKIKHAFFLNSQGHENKREM